MNRIKSPEKPPEEKDSIPEVPQRKPILPLCLLQEKCRTFQPMSISLSKQRFTVFYENKRENHPWIWTVWIDIFSVLTCRILEFCISSKAKNEKKQVAEPTRWIGNRSFFVSQKHFLKSFIIEGSRSTLSSLYAKARK